MTTFCDVESATQHRYPALLVLVILVGACRAVPDRDAGAGGSVTLDAGRPTPPTDAGTTDRGSGVPQSREEFLGRLLEARCDWHERCAPTFGRIDPTLGDCLAKIERGIHQFIHYNPRDTQLDPERAVVCLRSTAALACWAWPDSTDTSCSQALRRPDEHREGEACLPSMETYSPVCAPGLGCFAGEPNEWGEYGCGTCGLILVNGEACWVNSECRSGYCRISGETLRGTCASLAWSNTAMSGQRCTADLDCYGVLECAGPPGAMVCTQAANEGDRCSTWDLDDDPPCLTGLQCLPTDGGPRRCVAQPRPGEPCHRITSTSHLSCANFCRFQDATDQVGTCAPYEAPYPAAGAPCGVWEDRDVCEVGTATALPELLQPGDRSGGCMCPARRASGAPCTSPWDCQSNYCSATQVCTPQLPDGAPCHDTHECISEYCLAGVCAPNPGTPDCGYPL